MVSCPGELFRHSLGDETFEVELPAILMSWILDPAAATGRRAGGAAAERIAAGVTAVLA
jgi:hypothetical protein